MEPAREKVGRLNESVIEMSKLGIWILLLMFVIGLVFSFGLIPNAWLRSIPKWCYMLFLLPCALLVIADGAIKACTLFRNPTSQEQEDEKEPRKDRKE